MNREILFRGKRTDNGEWAEGFYVHIPSGRYGADEHMIQTVKPDGEIGMLHDVDPSTVCEYNGLTDKNGQRIFEEDEIVNYYIRFGEIPKDEMSGVWNHGVFDRKEIGVSVYSCVKINNKYHIIIPLPCPEDAISTLHSLLIDADRNVYLVVGDVVGHGSDNEPLLKNIRIIKDISEETYGVRSYNNNSAIVQVTPD